jgi:hypothetical protein
MRITRSARIHGLSLCDGEDRDQLPQIGECPGDSSSSNCEHPGAKDREVQPALDACHECHLGLNRRHEE